MKKREVLLFGLILIVLSSVLVSADLGTQSHNPITRWYEDEIQFGLTYEIDEFENTPLQFHYYGNSDSEHTINSATIYYAGINTLSENDISENTTEITATNFSLGVSTSIKEINATGISVTENTSFTWTIKTTDVNGDVNTSTITLRVLNDITPPTYSDEAPVTPSPAEYIPGQDYTFNITFEDNVEIDEVTFEFNGVNYSGSYISQNDNIYGIIIADPGVGDHTYRWYAIDNPGNQVDTGELTYTINSTSDNADLTIKGLQNQDVSMIYDSETTITVTANSTSGTHQLFRDGILIDGGSETVTLGGGVYTYVANSTGNQNYTADSGHTHTLTIEPAASEVNLLLDSTDGNVTIEETDSVNIEGETITGNNELKYYQDDVLITSGEKQFNTAETYNITVIHPQNQNYSDSQESHFIIVQISQSPTINFMNPTPGDGVNLAQNFISINVTASDPNLDTITIYFYNSSNSLVESSSSSTSPLSINVNNLADGVYIINATANDTINNINSTESRTITLDTTAPVYSNANELPEDSPTYSSAGQIFFFNITWRDNIELNSVTLEFDNVTYTNVSQNGNIFGMRLTNLLAENYIYRWSAIDNSGNQNITEDLSYTINNPTNPSSGGGGGGGGSSKNKGDSYCVDGYEEIDGECVRECSPNWECREWSSCTSGGYQTRSCIDTNSCGTNDGEPDESQSCAPDSDGRDLEVLETPLEEEPLIEELIEESGNMLTGAFVGGANLLANNKGRSILSLLVLILGSVGVWKRKVLKTVGRNLWGMVRKKREF